MLYLSVALGTIAFIILITSLTKTLDHIHMEVHQIMTTLADFRDKISRVSARVDAGNTALEGIKADIADLNEKIANGGLTTSEEAVAFDELTALEAKVDAAAANAEDVDDDYPVAPDEVPPDEPVEPEPPVGPFPDEPPVEGASRNRF